MKSGETKNRREPIPIIKLGLVPILLLLTAVWAFAPEETRPGESQRRAFTPAKHFRSVVFILDSAGESEMFDPELMPFLSSLQTSSLAGRSRSCAAKATFPCIKSIFEGQEATMGTTLQDFSAFPSSRTTWPASLAALGLRLVVASDHTLNRLYPHAFVDSLNYEDLHVPLLERDSFVYRKARRWLDDPSIDVLILHIIGTDKVSHEYPVRGPGYRQKYREVDDFIREVAGRLQPEDYLFAISDHGHNELGGHTEDAGYLARGPFFPPGVHQDLHAEDMLFLLSLPYGLLLPAGYEGQVRVDLTRLESAAGRNWLDAQAKSWRVPIADLPTDVAQARLNNETVRRRTEGQHNAAIDAVWRSAGFWLVAALFLMSELPRKERASGRWLLLLLELALLVALAFWLFPACLTFAHESDRRWMAFLGFYVVAGAWGFGRSRLINRAPVRDAVLDSLWMVGLCVWLLGYFGPLGYSLTRHGSLIILSVGPIAAVAASNGWRNLFSFRLLLWLALLPVVCYDVESFNIKFTLIDRLSLLPLAIRVSCVCLAAALFVVVSAPPHKRVKSALLIALWAAVAAFLFELPLLKLMGGLLASAWFVGCLELFRRARLPLRWHALIAAVFLFVLLSFFLNGFALSHVDFRFAANKIVPFAKEIWRAPQLILWAMAKYAFALAPALFVVERSGDGERVWRDLLLLGWWRELMIVASALGLAIFNVRGMHDLCAEEIYFWTFLNLVFFGAGLIAIWLANSRSGRDLATANAARTTL